MTPPFQQSSAVGETLTVRLFGWQVRIGAPLGDEEEVMGDKDSSKTRVQPVFDQLLKGDCRGEGWLRRLLQLPQRFDGVSVPIPDHPGTLKTCAWHPKEQTLRPPIALLRYLVERESARTGPPSSVRPRRPASPSGIVSSP